MIALILGKAMNFIPKPVYVGGIAALVILVVFQTWSLDRTRKELVQSKVDLAECVRVNDVNSITIGLLEEAGRDCVAGREADEQAFAKAAINWKEERFGLEEQSRKLQAERIEVYRDPNCAEFAKLNINDVCSGLGDSLRNQAEHYYRIRSGGEDSASPDTNTGGTPPAP